MMIKKEIARVHKDSQAGQGSAKKQDELDQAQKQESAQQGTSAAEDYIRNLYESSLEGTKQQLQADQETQEQALNEQQEQNQAQTEEALRQTYVEAAKRQKNNTELQNAQGLTSGAMAQERLSRENQMAADMTAIRTAQLEADAQIERQRTLLGQQYAAAITKAQKENDLAKAEALYAQAQKEEALLLQKKQAAAVLMAEEVGDFSLYKELYGLTDDQISALNGTAKTPTTTPETNPTPTGTEDQAPALTQPGNTSVSGNGVTLSSIYALGYGQDITPEQLVDLVASGVVEEYWEGGVRKFRRVSK